MIPCGVIRDLLVLYVSEECSEDTRELVEEHLKSCESCRRALEELKGPVLPREEPEIKAELDERAKDFQVKRGLRKIRRRWLASLLCVLLLFPLVGLGFMVRNQIEGEGVCFTNLDELYASYAFLKAVEKGNYEKAFSYIDVEGMYEEMTTGQLDGFTDWDALYTKAEIGGKVYYVDKEIYLNEYRTYQADGDEARFWESILIDNSQHSCQTPIPGDVFDEAVALFKEDYFEEQLAVTIVTDETVDEILRDDPDVDIYECYYSAITSEEGDTYYYLSYGNDTVSELINIFGDYSKCLPEVVFEQLKTETAKDYARNSACADYYRDMGLEMYTQLLKEEFLSNMQELEQTGITIKSFSLEHIYDGGQIDMALRCVQQGVLYDLGGICFASNGGRLTIGGGFYSLSSGEEFLSSDHPLMIFTNLLHLSWDPAGYYLEYPYD